MFQLILINLLKQAIHVEPDVQALRVTLMTMYGCVSIGGKECMGIINPANTNEAMHLSHLAMDIWAELLAIHKPGVTLMRPPTGPEFRWLPISKLHSRKASTASSVQSTSQVPIVSHHKSTPRSDSPAPRPLPHFDCYLDYCSIEKDNQETRDLLKKYNIVNFEMFLSSELSCAVMAGFGFGFGQRVRLHENAISYRQHLKDEANPTF
ncbi:uncharacterized protein MELLADRAFT_89274 [Melampsora larici-populina 98AG31]|uniref:Uncharacterized protein n=1 Tax=Melampsora larici-populina (strain 98AG31 / pathotype 3-4-7) TaxID=747676 RepID=F4R5K4_MELLP|nr:uncharacterized protein MELLADRAFT_89274 [Melampsora larici-populina 98AG31]EGG12062.1 hypothetical protein MELLADRAFT_89274 [Melampsora larici-populina 98AG31]